MPINPKLLAKAYIRTGSSGRRKTAECAEIAGLSGLGASEVEAIKELKIAMGVWLDHLKASGSPVPAPRLISRTRTRSAPTNNRASR